MALDDTPELAAADLDRLTRSKTSGLKMTAELVEHWLLEIAEDADGREEVVEVRVEGVCGTTRWVGDERVLEERKVVCEVRRGRWRKAARDQHAVEVDDSRCFLELGVASEVLADQSCGTSHALTL
jgi:hypothetical protein